MRSQSTAIASNNEDLKKRVSLSAVRRVLGLALPYKGILSVSAVLMIAVKASQLLLPIVGKAAVDRITTTKSIAELDRYALLLIALVVVSSALGYVQYMISAFAGNSIVRGLRQEVFAHLQRLPVAFFDRTRSGDLGSHLSNDVSQLQTSLTDDVSGFLGNILMFLGGSIIAFGMVWQLSMVILCCLALMLTFFVVAGRSLRKLNRSGLDALADAIGSMTEVLANIRLVKAFVREPYEDRRSGEKLEKVFRLSMRSSKLEGLMTVVGMGGLSLMIILCGWYGYRAVLSGAFTAGSIVGFVLVLFEMLPALTQLASLYTRLQRAVGASERIFAILDESKETEPANPIPLPHGPGKVDFRDIEFSYIPESPVLTGLSLDVAAGQVTALVGPSGSGKTTLAALLYRFYSPQQGSIAIDGVNIDRVTSRDLREKVGIVPQDPILFDGTIWENIRYGRLEATDEDIRRAAKEANVEEFVRGFPLGFETQIGERGITLSGGQRQRVSIARALLKDPAILVLDEATSSLDNKSESLVREALDRLMQGRTTLVIAHRLSTIRNAHQIAVVDGGRIAEIGTHEDLLSREGKYADLYQLVGV